jgi:hypothetical protein
MQTNQDTVDAEIETTDSDTALAVTQPVVGRVELSPRETPAAPVRTAASAKVDAIADLTAVAYQRASQLALTPEEIQKLQAPFPDECFQPGASGKENLIYIEHAALRQRLNEVIGIGQWSIIPRSRWSEDYRTAKGYDASRVYVEAMLLVRGCFVAEAVGDMSYFKHNDSQNYGDAVEGAKTAALRRCCKELGVGLQAWSKDWCNGWWERKRGGRVTTPAAQPPAASPAPTPCPAPSPEPAPEPSCATAKTREWMLKEINASDPAAREIATEYFQKIDQLMPTEALEDLPLRFVPTSKNELKRLVAAIGAFEMGDEAQSAFDPHEEPEPTKPKPAKEKPVAEGTKASGTVEHVTVKNGQSKKGPWTLYGVKIAGAWFNTFDTKLGELAESLKGQNASFSFTENERGKTLTAIAAL